MEQLTLPSWAPTGRRQYPFGAAAGRRELAMGSDWSVSTPDPLLEMEVAVNRVSHEHRGQRPAFLPEERIGLDDALAGFTGGSAHANHLDRDAGIDRGRQGGGPRGARSRPVRPRAGAIGEARVLATFIDGVAVYERPELDG